MDGDALAAARAAWHWTGARRPPWAEEPRPGQVSVWDFPRPPALQADAREVVVRWGADTVVHTRRAIRVCETGHPPSWYLPWDDVRRDWLRPAGGGSFCEWKGPAHYWDLDDGMRRLAGIAWSYPHPLAGAEALADRVAFYARGLDVTVDGVAVRPQPGGFYGGWITPELAGPFKGGPGSAGW